MHLRNVFYLSALLILCGVMTTAVAEAPELTIMSPASLPGADVQRVMGQDVSGVDVEQFLTPDGRFDLEAARRLGYEGSVNLEGFRASIDPVSGASLYSGQRRRMLPPIIPTTFTGRHSVQGPMVG